MTLRPRATEIPELVRRLGSRDPARVDAARARLAIIGARAVEALIEAIEGDSNRTRAHAMSLLALIQDPRGREPLMAMLMDRDARMRETAARCLGRFPCSGAAAALERILGRERILDVRIAAIQALIEQYASGQETAVRSVLSLLLDPEQEPRLRGAALALLPALRPAARRGLLKRLRQDPVPEIAARAAEAELEADPPSERATAAVRRLARELASQDYAEWNEAVHRLAALGAAAVSPVVQEMRRRAHDPEYCARAGMALKALGPRRGRELAEALDRVDDPLPLQVLVEVIGALGEKSLVYRLKDLIDRVAPRTDRREESNGIDPMRRVRAKAHLELARIGSRVAIRDLREALADPDRRVDLEILAAAELIGKKDEIPDLLRAHAREDRYVRGRIATVVRAIMKRERIRRNSSLFRTLGADQRRALESILSARPAAAPGGSRAARPRRR